MKKFKLIYKIGNKTYIFKSNNKNDCINKLLRIIELTGKVKYQIKTWNSIGYWQYIAGYSDINF